VGFSEKCLEIIPIGSMYGIYANIWGILMINVTIYSIHGSYGIWDTMVSLNPVVQDPGSLQCEAPKIDKLANITPITMVYGIYNYSYWGESKPTNISWGPHIVLKWTIFKHITSSAKIPPRPHPVPLASWCLQQPPGACGD